jgi:hypothetical protein
VDKIEYDRNLTLLQEKLEEKTFARFWAKGMGMTFEQTIEFALEEVGVEQRTRS